MHRTLIIITQNSPILLKIGVTIRFQGLIRFICCFLYSAGQYCTVNSTFGRSSEAYMLYLDRCTYNTTCRHSRRIFLFSVALAASKKNSTSFYVLGIDDKGRPAHLLSGGKHGNTICRCQVPGTSTC